MYIYSTSSNLPVVVAVVVLASASHGPSNNQLAPALKDGEGDFEHIVKLSSDGSLALKAGVGDFDHTVELPLNDDGGNKGRSIRATGSLGSGLSDQ
jgi:hypothetical protein